MEWICCGEPFLSLVSHFCPHAVMQSVCESWFECAGLQEDVVTLAEKSFIDMLTNRSDLVLPCSCFPCTRT